VTVRLNPASVRILTMNGKPFKLPKNLQSIRRPGFVKCWDVQISGQTEPAVAGRLCVIHKSQEAIALAQMTLRRRANKHGEELQPQTLEYAKYVMLFSTFPESSFADTDILEWYRIRWQVELVFKRFKSIAGLGHLPKYDEQTAKAWLYVLKDYNVMSTADRERQAQAFYDKFGDTTVRSTVLKLAATVGMYTVAIAGISAALH